MPWLRVEQGRVSDQSKKAIDEVFLALGGRIFFTRVEPMKSRSYFPRRGYGEFVSELVSFARMAQALAEVWKGEGVVVDLATQIRTVYGFGGKGGRSEVSLELERVCIINNVIAFSGLFLALDLHKLQKLRQRMAIVVVQNESSHRLSYEGDRARPGRGDEGGVPRHLRAAPGLRSCTWRIE